MFAALPGLPWIEVVHDAGQTASVVQAADFMERMDEPDSQRKALVCAVVEWAVRKRTSTAIRLSAFGVRLPVSDSRKAAIAKAGRRKPITPLANSRPRRGWRSTTGCRRCRL